MKKLTWKKPYPTAPNVILNGKNFYVSFNSFDGSEPLLIGAFGSDGGEAETALKSKRGKEWLILNGDFRKEYEKLVPKGYTACKKFYLKMAKKNRSSWSTD